MTNIECPDDLIKVFKSSYDNNIKLFKLLSEDVRILSFTEWLFRKIKYDDFMLDHCRDIVSKNSDISDFIYLFDNLIDNYEGKTRLTFCSIESMAPKIVNGSFDDIDFTKDSEYILLKDLDIDPKVKVYNSLNDFMSAFDLYQKNFLKDILKDKLDDFDLDFNDCKNFEYFDEIADVLKLSDVL